MRLFALSLYLCLIVCQSFGQETSPEKIDLRLQERHYNSLKWVGLGLTAAGAGGVITAIALHHKPLYYYDNGKPYYGISTEQVLFFMGGVSCLGFGIPVSIVGGYKQSKYKKLIKGISVGSESSYQGRGIKVVFHI